MSTYEALHLLSNQTSDKMDKRISVNLTIIAWQSGRRTSKTKLRVRWCAPWATKLMLGVKLTK